MPENTEATRRTLAALGAAVTAELDPTYTLIYAESDRLPTDVVAALVRGENEWETQGGEGLTQWKCDIVDTAARQVVDDLTTQVMRRWERADDTTYPNLLEEWSTSLARDAVIETVRDRDESTWFDDMVTRHGAVLLRVGIATMDEDAGLSHKPLPPRRFLDLLGFAHTEHNLTRAAEVVDNASPEFSVVMGYALLGADLADIVRLPGDGARTVQLRNPHIWLGSPFTGSGWCSDEPFDGTLTVHRGDLRTDEDAFGHSWEKVAGGTSPSYFSSGSLVPVEPEPAGRGRHREPVKRT
ncbi:hypothetical protein [Kutzneria sp. 744]|uniref:hypothetical protein n=1 Tax=Kutzneria sp. (strain 744) TaxID=345341 RepID=UPI0003EEB6A5|nr:hypothetical protein [Kutzneria sp. 744]EWM19631.1 hypothetical protein KUTG_09935 [Kutzneria sp. 744]